MGSIDSEAEVAPVAVRVPEPTGWIGQRVPFYVDLRSRGTFSGTASFELPQVPGAMVVKIGEPVVETEELEGAEWFVQRHEFALFSQKAGPLEIPPFPVRFSRRAGYTGAASDVQTEAAGLAFEIRRPPGSEELGFLVTTESLEIEEAWDPAPGPARVGDVFKRTIVQRAEQLTGMALAPAPLTGPDGIRVYRGDVATKDDLYRGAFLGERSESITYLLQKPGTLELPSLTYVWWNPVAEKLESKSLPAVTFEVAALPVSPAAGESRGRGWGWSWPLGVVLLGGIVAWQRRRLAGWLTLGWRILNPPERVAARALLRACRANDPAAAASAWSVWRGARESAEAVPVSPLPASNHAAGKEREHCWERVLSAIEELQRHLFGPASAERWQGSALAGAVREFRSSGRGRSTRARASILPSLNPTR